MAQVKVAQAEVDRARVDVSLAKKDVERTTVRAQRDGVVSKRAAQVGAYVQKGSPLLALVAAQDLWILANFKETQMERVRPGMSTEESTWTPIRARSSTLTWIASRPVPAPRFSLLPPENAWAASSKWCSASPSNW